MQLIKLLPGSKTTLATLALSGMLALNPLAHAASKHGGDFGHESGSDTVIRHNARAEFTDYAQVTHVEPVYRRIKYQRPVQQCWYEDPEHTTFYGHRDRTQRPAQAIVGGIVGGVIGNHIGRRTGSDKARLGATVAGAIVGSALANEAANKGHRRHRPLPPSYTVTEGQPGRQCQEVYETHYKRKIIGYNVTYRYRGRTHTTHTRKKPGRRLTLQVSLSPKG